MVMSKELKLWETEKRKQVGEDIRCVRCDDKGMDLYEAEYSIDVYCDCEAGTKRQNKEMCTVCSEAWKDCVCPDKQQRQPAN